MTIAIITALTILAIINLAASFYVSRAPAFTRRQKIFQIILIWLVPLLGAGFFSYFLWNDRQKRRLGKQIGNDTSITDSAAMSHYIAARHRGGR